MADGTIDIEVKVDAAGAHREMDGLEAKAKKTEREMEGVGDDGFSGLEKSAIGAKGALQLLAGAAAVPMAPSKVSTDLAASTATGVPPICMTAALNSSAVISPSSMALRKLPVYAPACSSASCNLPDAPGMASVSWFQFSVVSLPAPAVCVMTMATLRMVSSAPPKAAFMLPAACVSPT